MIRLLRRLWAREQRRGEQADQAPQEWLDVGHEPDRLERPDAQRPAVLRLQESAAFMGVLLDDLLEISRLDAQVLAPERETVRSVVAQMSAIAGVKSITRAGNSRAR